MFMDVIAHLELCLYEQAQMAVASAACTSNLAKYLFPY